jgi:hypothetical protein
MAAFIGWPERHRYSAVTARRCRGDGRAGSWPHETNARGSHGRGLAGHVRVSLRPVGRWRRIPAGDGGRGPCHYAGHDHDGVVVFVIAEGQVTHMYAGNRADVESDEICA